MYKNFNIGDVNKIMLIQKETDNEIRENIEHLQEITTKEISIHPVIINIAFEDTILINTKNKDSANN